jgi:CheY-like chemotaxis protein
MIGAPPPVVRTDGSGVPPGAALPRTLLVVDDLSSVCTSIAYYLEVCGYRTFKADSGLAALETYRREQIDGVLLDIQMAVMNGFQTCVQLQVVARETGRLLPVWFMTGIHYRELEEDCAKAGGRTVFHKPFEWPQMLAELEQGLALLPPRTGPDAETRSPSP